MWIEILICDLHRRFSKWVAITSRASTLRQQTGLPVTEQRRARNKQSIVNQTGVLGSCQAHTHLGRTAGYGGGRLREGSAIGQLRATPSKLYIV